jgi:hypothetical protein
MSWIIHLSRARLPLRRIVVVPDALFKTWYIDPTATYIQPVELTKSQTNRANNDKLDKNEQTDALKFLIHFFGDLHQPLYAEGLDRGGNEIHVYFDGRCGRDENLHSI